MKGIIIGTVVACAALIGIAVFFTVNGQKQGPRIVEMNDQYTARVADGYWKKGATEPKVTVTEYLDFQCPSCQAAFPVMQEVYRATSDFAEFQVKIYPIVSSHDKAKVSARAAEAAGRQGKFWEMHDLLFTHQKTWEVQTPAQFQTTAETYASNLGLDIEQFKRDMKDSTIDDPVDRNVTQANTIPITGTPSFLINGVLLQSMPPTGADFIELLRKTAGLDTAEAGPTL